MTPAGRCAVPVFVLLLDNSKKRRAAQRRRKNRLTGGGVRGYGRGVTHPLLDRAIVGAVERAASEHLGTAWTCVGFTDLNHRASHPCGIFAGRAFSVFAKLDGSPAGQAHVTAELNGFGLIRARTETATPVPVADGLVMTSAGALLLSEALPERGSASGLAADYRTAEDYAAIGRALAGLHQARDETFGLAEFDGFFGPLRQRNRPVGSPRWCDFYAERRVLPMLRFAVDSGHLPAGLARAADGVTARLPSLCGPDPAPALLHGDAQQNNFVSTANGAVLVDVAPYFGHPEYDLALVDYISPADPALFRAYAELAPVDAGFAGRRELWRLPVYLAVIGVDGANPFGRSFLPRLDAALRQYA
jgi:protein-ribulosamine 3-kinase